MTTFCSTVEGAHIEAKRQCPKCHTQQLSFLKSLSIAVKDANFCTRVEVEAEWGDVSEKGELQHIQFCLRSYLDREGCFRDMLDVQDIEEHLLTGERFEVVHNRENIITSLKKVVQDVSVAGSEVSDVDLLKVGLTQWFPKWGEPLS